jgi:hypothetical protein
MQKLRAFTIKGTDLHIYFQAFVPCLITYKTSLLVSEPSQLLIADQLANWNIVFPVSGNANTQIISAVESKDKVTVFLWKH